MSPTAFFHDRKKTQVHSSPIRPGHETIFTREHGDRRFDRGSAQLILIDARQRACCNRPGGHSWLVHLLGIRHVVLAVNKNGSGGL